VAVRTLDSLRITNGDAKFSQLPSADRIDAIGCPRSAMVEGHLDTERSSSQRGLLDIMGDVAQRWTAEEGRDEQHVNGGAWCVGRCVDCADHFDCADHSERADRNAGEFRIWYPFHGRANSEHALFSERRGHAASVAG
jgi:hypothetical protein